MWSFSKLVRLKSTVINSIRSLITSVLIVSAGETVTVDESLFEDLDDLDLGDDDEDGDPDWKPGDISDWAWVCDANNLEYKTYSEQNMVYFFSFQNKDEDFCSGKDNHSVFKNKEFFQNELKVSSYNKTITNF